jgi:hypothetical protein
MDTRTFYGPHECERCSIVIVKASREEGGEEFEQPDGPIYPNTPWQRHNCKAAHGSDLRPIVPTERP